MDRDGSLFYTGNHTHQMVDSLRGNICHRVRARTLPTDLAIYPLTPGGAEVLKLAIDGLALEIHPQEVNNAEDADIYVIDRISQAIWVDLAARGLTKPVFFLIHEREGISLKKFAWEAIPMPAPASPPPAAGPAPSFGIDVAALEAQITFPDLKEACGGGIADPGNWPLCDETHAGPATDTFQDHDTTDEVTYPKSKEEQMEYHIRSLLELIGDDHSREGLLETPARVRKAFRHWFSGYSKDPKSVLKVFADGGEDCDSMVVVKDIPFFSHCEHHMAPFFGTATIAYIPNDKSRKIVGLSKLSRLVDVFARRLQVQERLTSQIANVLFKELDARGVGVIIKARHLCMESRGVSNQGHHTITSALRGVIKNRPSVRVEFLTLAK